MTHPRPLRDMTLTRVVELDPDSANVESRSHQSHQVGLRARRDFAKLRLWRRARYPRIERLYWRLLKPVFAAILIAWYTPQYARAVRRKFGVPILKQIREQCLLGFGDWVNPRNYYFHEHYRRA